MEAKKISYCFRSSAEVEYRALAAVSSKLVWIQHLLDDLQIKTLLPTIIVCWDNEAINAIATNPTFHERAKHGEIDYHFVRDKILEGFVKLLSIRSTSQIADVFTQGSFSPSVLHTIMCKLGVIDIHTPALGEYHFYYFKC